jgi:hypothetical protein
VFLIDKENEENENRTGNISYPQVRQRWFSVGIFPPGLLFGLTGKYHAVSHSNVLGKQKA